MTDLIDLAHKTRVLSLIEAMRRELILLSDQIKTGTETGATTSGVVDLALLLLQEEDWQT